MDVSADEQAVLKKARDLEEKAKEKELIAVQIAKLKAKASYVKKGPYPELPPDTAILVEKFMSAIMVQDDAIRSEITRLNREVAPEQKLVEAVPAPVIIFIKGLSAQNAQIAQTGVDALVATGCRSAVATEALATVQASAKRQRHFLDPIPEKVSRFLCTNQLIQKLS